MNRRRKDVPLEPQGGDLTEPAKGLGLPECFRAKPCKNALRSPGLILNVASLGRRWRHGILLISPFRSGGKIGGSSKPGRRPGRCYFALLGLNQRPPWG